MEGLPLLPGYSFKDLTQTRFNVVNQFYYKNGYALPKRTEVGIGGKHLAADSVAYRKDVGSIRYDPSLTYGRIQPYNIPFFVPHFVIYDKKCLAFNAFFKQSVVESPWEHYRIRQVNIVYFLENDTITVMEPPVENAGFAQGRIVKRGKIPKTTAGQYWHWKDLNVGMDVAFYGVVYHIVNCDTFTREFLESQGIEVNPPEQMPDDPYTADRRRKILAPQKVPGVVDDKLRRFLEYDGKVLRFFALWDTRDQEFGDLIPCEIFYFLADDTVQVKEVFHENDGKDPYPVLLSKIKLPKNWKEVPVTFPSVYLEKSDAEVTEYYQPKDFLIGETIFVLGRRLLIYDCDLFTRNYFEKVLNIKQGEPLDISEKPAPPKPLTFPPHIGIGSPEDTLQSCLSFDPKPPKKDMVKYILNANKVLRYEAEMDWVHPEDQGRKFLITYFLSDGKISVYEPPIRNSGFLGGLFLKPTLLPKPGTNMDLPEYYTPEDFYIGAIISVYHHRFFITSADLFVYRYMEENPDKFSTEIINNIRNYFVSQGYLKEEIQCEMEKQTEEQANEDITEGIKLPENEPAECKPVES